MAKRSKKNSVPEEIPAELQVVEEREAKEEQAQLEKIAVPISRGVIYGLLVNDKVDEPPLVKGNWYVKFIDLSNQLPVDQQGPFALLDQQGRQLSGYVALPALKAAARQIFRGNQNGGNYAVHPFQLKETGMKIMITMIFTTD